MVAAGDRGTHANLAGVSVALLAAHVVTAVVDGFADIDRRRRGPVPVVLPTALARSGHPGQHALLAAVLTARSRSAVPDRLAPDPPARLPGLAAGGPPRLGTGSDTTSLPVLLLTFAALLAVAAAVLRLELSGHPALGLPSDSSCSRCRSARPLAGLGRRVIRRAGPSAPADPRPGRARQAARRRADDGHLDLDGHLAVHGPMTVRPDLVAEVGRPGRPRRRISAGPQDAGRG